MKLHHDLRSGLNTVTAYGAGFVEVNGARYATGVRFMPEGPVEAWTVDSIEALSARELEPLLAGRPDLVLLGTGARQRFVAREIVAALSERSIGVECMSSHAACRTYNILMSEGRQVLAALIVEAAPTG